MDVTVDVTPSQSGKGGVVKVSTTDSNLKFTLHLLGNGNKTERMKITSGMIENIPSGSYDLIIQSKSKGYCSETRTVTVN